MSRKAKDETLEALKVELDRVRAENKTYGLNDYRRGFKEAIERAIEIRKRELRIEAVAAKGERAAKKVLARIK